MIKRLFAVFDNKAIFYSAPFAESSTAQATRAFSDAITSPNSTLAKHPKDFTLYELGTYDTESGRVESHNQPIHVAHAVEFVRIKPSIDGLPLHDRETGEVL